MMNLHKTVAILSRVDFLKKLEIDNFLDLDFVVSEEILINKKNVKWHFRVIKNITFKERVVIRDCELNSGLVFQNCTFEKDIYFLNVKSTNYNSTYNPDNESICFDNSTVNFILIEECFLERSLKIKGECIIEKLEITGLHIKNSDITIRRSTISHVYFSNILSDVTLSNSTLKSSIRLETILGNLSLINNEFYEEVMIWNLESPRSFILNFNLFKDDFEITASRINELIIIGDAFDKKVTYENRDTTGKIVKTYLNKLYISEAIFLEGFNLEGLEKKIDEIRLPISPSSKGILKFVGWDVQDLNISGINQNLKLLFNRCSFGFFVVNEFSNFSDISFYRCKGIINSSLNLSNCDLGSTKFNDFKFDTFSVIRIDNAVLDNIKLSSCSWFEDNSLFTNMTNEDFKGKREIYRQFKQALKNNGNQIESLLFQSRELSTYKKELKVSNRTTFGDKVIMCVSQTNDFGINWVKPLIILIFGTFLTYLLILPVISNKINYSISFSNKDIINTLNVLISNLKCFWLLLNPIRSFELVYGKEISISWIYLLDLLHRVFLGIMIFQIIKAFRKFVSN